jgi:ectoine hydroxylase-related dioxygenase (phytanoyl-CoA dioxygenase family)
VDTLAPPCPEVTRFVLDRFTLTDQQLAFFRAFGFLKLEGALLDRIDEIADAFDELFATIPATAEFGDLVESDFTENFAEHARIDTYQHLNFGRQRAIIPGFIERSERLAGLSSDPQVVGPVRSILGPDFEYVGGDGNVFSCDTAWHNDVYGSPPDRNHLKVFFYLDELTSESGALRVIPGSNHVGSPFTTRLWQMLGEWTSIPDRLGVEWDEIPCHTVTNQPGDLLLGDFRTFHATINSGERRRLFTLNYRQAA